MNAGLHIEHQPRPFAWAEGLRDADSRQSLSDDDFEFGCLLAEMNAANLINWCDAYGMIALHCAPLRVPVPHTAALAVQHHHGLEPPFERARQLHLGIVEDLRKLFGLAVPLAVREHKAAELRFRKAASGALLRRLPTQAAGQAGCTAAAFLLLGNRMEELLSEEAAWWMRRRADA